MLSSLRPDLVVYQNSTSYAISNSYWSRRQSELGPNCFFTPHTASDVSLALSALTESRSPFTVKAGGHTAFAGGSSVDKGVTIDLLYLNDVVVSGDRDTVSVGPGARWGNVSSTLDRLGLAVVGGRVTDVGVAGLILGGGISFFSGRRGWACDNVRSFEVVIPSGEILTVSPTEEPDLYWALRGGGGSSFGVVTRFDLEAFPQGDLWSSSLIFSRDVARGDLLPIISDLAQNGLNEDVDAHAFFVYTFLPQLGGYVGFTSAYHAQPSPSNPEQIPEVFEPLQALPTLSSTITVANVTTLVSSISEPYGIRATWWDTTIQADSPVSLLKDIKDVFETFVTNVNQQGTVTPFLVFQPITASTILQMQRNGGNALGLKPEDGALWIVQLSARWTDPLLDETVETEAEIVVGKIEEMARQGGVLRGFKYMNYAGKTQDVYASYGAASVERLREVADEYDPEHLLPELWKGYFQVD